MRDVATLLEALPYIREFHGSTVVIKYGGAAMDDPLLREEFARDVVLLKYVGMSPIVVHGGGPDITAYMKRLDMPVEFVGGLRVSDEATVEIAKMVLVGKLNTDIVLRIGRHGQPAVGLSGDDGSLLRCSRRTAPGGGLGRRGRRGQLLQRQRRRGGGGDRGGVGRAHGDLPDRRARLAA
jgi:acetylglutamate kinase